jgi:hypothetical protein
MMQDIILARVWADHHQRAYGDAGELPAAATRPAGRDRLPAAGKAMALALAASVASLGSSLATVAGA